MSRNETDRLALLAFKSLITHDPQKVTSSWNESRHFCDWEGVECSLTHQRVTAMNLSSKGLVGTISPHIGNLSFLNTLILKENSFHGEIPSQIGQLFRLEILHVGENNLVGEIPVTISLCSDLRRLFLNGNHLVGKIPMELGSLSKLVDFVLDSNNLTGGVPPFLGNLTSLETLSIRDNPFAGSIPSTLNQLKSLKNLALGLCKLSGKFPLSLWNLSSFEIISIEGNKLSGNLPFEIGLNLPNLQILYIGSNQFSGPIPTSLFNASRIQEIDISSNQFTGKVPLHVGNPEGLSGLRMHENNLGSGKLGDLDFFTTLYNCSKLRYFSISHNQFGGMLPLSIGNFSKNLQHLMLDSNLISGEIPPGIENLENLIRVGLTDNYLNGSIPRSIGNLQKLQVLNMLANELSGRIPPSFRNMSQLFALDMSYNSLEGSIAPCLGNQNLQLLDLSGNYFTGSIPKQEIGLASRLQELILKRNSFSGSIPPEFGNLKNLYFLDLSKNNLSGEIPSAVGSCSSLERLHFQSNILHGSVPSSLGSLKGLQDLDLSSNNISGEIPKELENLSFLRSLNLSFNNIEGEVPVKGVFRNVSAISLSGNHKICGGIQKLGLPKCLIQKLKKQGSGLAVKVILGVVVPSFVVVLFLIIYLRRRRNEKPPSEQHLGDLRRVSYHDLYKATDGFSSTNLIGMGSCGSVFKGILHQDEGHVAVKVLNLMEPGASKSFMAECEALRQVRHRNILKVLTVCSSVDFNGNEFKALVFEFMPNGNLETWLHPSSAEEHPSKRLDVYQRIKIALDIASALDYVHNRCETAIVHCDLKPSNVLLDYDMTARVGDFGLAKFIFKDSNKNETNSIAIRGTIGYIPPEYGMGAGVSGKGDVYSYGILLLEMITGKRPTDHIFNDGLSLRDFSQVALSRGVVTDIIDIRLLPEETSNQAAKLRECLNSLIRIGVACCAELMTERMDIEDVIKELHSINNFLLQVVEK